MLYDLPPCTRNRSTTACPRSPGAFTVVTVDGDQIPHGDNALAGDGQLRERPEVRLKPLPRTGHTIRDAGIVLVAPGAPVQVERGEVPCRR